MCLKPEEDVCLRAAVAANLALVGMGTDTGNSVRGPASHCNLVGMRPTLGLTSRLATLLIRLSDPKPCEEGTQQ